MRRDANVNVTYYRNFGARQVVGTVVAITT